MKRVSTEQTQTQKNYEIGFSCALASAPRSLSLSDFLLPPSSPHLSPFLFVSTSFSSLRHRRRLKQCPPHVPLPPVRDAARATKLSARSPTRHKIPDLEDSLRHMMMLKGL
jgi:hypothetical protein